MQMWELEDHPVQFEGWFVRSTKESTSAGQFLALICAGNIGDTA